MCESSMLGRLFPIGIRIRGTGKHVDKQALYLTPAGLPMVPTIFHILTFISGRNSCVTYLMHKLACSRY